MSVLTLFICLTFSPMYSRYFVYSKPPFATLSRRLASKFPYMCTDHTVHLSSAFPLSRAHVSLLSRSFQCVFLFFFFIVGTLPVYSFSFFPSFVARPPRTPHPFPLILSLSSSFSSYLLVLSHPLSLSHNLCVRMHANPCVRG